VFGVRFPVRWALALLLVGGITVAIAQNVVAEDRPASASPTVEQARAARGVLVEVDRLQLCYHEHFDRFSDRLAELIKYSRDNTEEPTQGTAVLAMASEGRFGIELSTSRDGQTYIQRITGGGVDTYLERDAANEFVDYGQYGWNHVKHTCAN
jgi:hypothetical protein